MDPEPSTTEWVLAGGAALLIVVVGGLHLIRPALRPSVSPASRLAGFLLAALAVAMVVIAAVLVGAGIRAAQMDPSRLGDDGPAGAFAGYLVGRDPGTAERVAQYGAALLLPLAGTLGVLALAAVDAGRSIGLRAVAGLVCGGLLVISILVAVGDAGPLAARTAVAVAVLATGATVALAVDELTTPRRYSTSSFRSSASTTRSQRSRQSSQR